MDFKFHLRRDGITGSPITAGLTTWLDIKLPALGSNFVVNANAYGGKGTLATRTLP